MADTADEKLLLHIEGIERLEEEKKNISEDIKDRYAVAKSDGFETKALRIVIRRRAMERAAREELDAIVQTYEGALA